MSFDETQHVRDQGGKFTHKSGTHPEVSLAEVDPYEARAAKIDEVEARVAAAKPGTVGENPAHWFDKEELIEATGVPRLEGEEPSDGLHKLISAQPTPYLEWYFRNRADVLSGLAKKGGETADAFRDGARTFRNLEAIAERQTQASKEGRTRISGIPGMRETRELDATSVASLSSALDKILSVPASRAGDMDFTYERPTTGEGDHVVRVRNMASPGPYDRIVIDYSNKQSDEIHRSGAQLLARRLALQEDFLARQEGISPRNG